MWSRGIKLCRLRVFLQVVSEQRVLGENKVTWGVITGISINVDLEKLKQSIQGGEVGRMKDC